MLKYIYCYFGIMLQERRFNMIIKTILLTRKCYWLKIYRKQKIRTQELTIKKENKKQYKDEINVNQNKWKN